MAEHHIAIDLTDAQGWRATGRAEAVSSRIPCVLLPLHDGERPLAGPISENHRRGSGLMWPPEAQVPLLGDAARGTGRVPLAALWAQLVQGEKGGLLENTWMEWRPTEGAPKGMDAAPLLAHAIRAWAPDAAVVVTPDGLGPAGQQALLDSLDREVHLIPASVAAALNWCRARSVPASLLEKATPGDGTPEGYLWVVHAGWGLWSAVPMQLRAVLAKDKPFLTPVFSRRQVCADLGLSGAVMLSSQRNVFEAAAQDWDPQWPVQGGLVGKVATFDLAAWSPLLGGISLSNSFRRLEQACQASSVEGRCIGVVVHGAWAEAAGQSLSHVFRCPLLLATQGAAAAGASLAEKNWRIQLPAWKEELDPFDMYRTGKDELGNPRADWKPLVEAATVDAWTEYNPPPIEGLSIPSGVDALNLVLRAQVGDRYEFRGVRAKLDRPLEVKSPVMLEVHMNPGQGFARVDVRSCEPGLFESRLDWRHLSRVDPPSPPKIGYIPRSVVIQADMRLWKEVEPSLIEFLAVTSQNALPQGLHLVPGAIRRVTQKLNRWPKASDFEWRMGRRLHADNIYLFYSAIGSDGKLPAGIGKDARGIWDETCKRAMDLLNHPSGRLDRVTQSSLRRMMAWSYADCPDSLQRVSEQAIGGGFATREALHMAGLCFRTSQRLAKFWQVIARYLPHVTAPNEWLRACRNIVRLNEHALSPAHVDDATIRVITAAIHRRFLDGVEYGKPTIAGNAMEALMHLLKRRRYQRDFLLPGDSIREQMEVALFSSLSISRRHEAMREPFLKLLRSEAGEADFAALVVSDEDEDE